MDYIWTPNFGAEDEVESEGRKLRPETLDRSVDFVFKKIEQIGLPYLERFRTMADVESILRESIEREKRFSHINISNLGVCVAIDLLEGRRARAIELVESVARLDPAESVFKLRPVRKLLAMGDPPVGSVDLKPDAGEIDRQGSRAADRRLGDR
jgi:hypothetical protein